MARIEKKVLIEEKLLKEALTWLDAQRKLFDDPEVMNSLGFVKKQGLKVNRKSLKKTMSKIEELLK